MGTTGGAEERTAFEQFARAHADRFARLAYVLTGHREATHDLVQETLVALWRAWPRVDADSPSAYARRVMVDTAGQQISAPGGSVGPSSTGDLTCSVGTGEVFHVQGEVTVTGCSVARLRPVAGRSRQAAGPAARAASTATSASRSSSIHSFWC
jgi:DNA-directed RNA polymerase specialized sigma24 family protein